MRKIVVLKPHEWLREGFLRQSAATATSALRQFVPLSGVRFRAVAPPVPLAIGTARRDVRALRDIQLRTAAMTLDILAGSARITIV